MSVNPPEAADSARKDSTFAPIQRKRSKANLRRGVSFKVGLIADQLVERYYGPLIQLDQVCVTVCKIMKR